VRDYRYRVDREGRVFHDGTEVVDPQVLRFFVLAMRRTEDGRWLVVCQGERNWFDAEGTPLVVQRIRPLGDGSRPAALELGLAGDHREPLDPGTLALRDGDLFCRVRRGALPARFGRVALHQLAPFLAEDAAGPRLLLGGVAHPILPADGPP
jgi:hypothetical protein